MQRYGPPPSYPYLKIPGLNAPLPGDAGYGGTMLYGREYEEEPVGKYFNLENIFQITLNYR
jgi:hypothetical protein